MDNEKKMIEVSQSEAEAIERMRAAEKAKKERDAYHDLTSELVEKYVPLLSELSEQLARLKTEVYTEFAQLIAAKGELFSIREGQRTHAWRNVDSTLRLTLGYHKRDGWADTVEDGILIVKEYISSLSGDEQTQTLVRMILDLLAKDKQGNLKADKVLLLEKHAMESGNARFIEGVSVIREAYRPEMSKQFIKAEYKDDKNEWILIPLSITEALMLTESNKPNNQED